MYSFWNDRTTINALLRHLHLPTLLLTHDMLIRVLRKCHSGFKRHQADGNSRGACALIFHMTGGMTLRWRHNERIGVSNHQRFGCLLNCLLRHGSKKTSKPRVAGHCEGTPPMTGGLPWQRASNAENVSIWWRHHGCVYLMDMGMFVHIPTGFLTMEIMVREHTFTSLLIRLFNPYKKSKITFVTIWLRKNA